MSLPKQKIWFAVIKNLFISGVKRGKSNQPHKPKIVVGRYTYGFENIQITWSGDAEVVIGSFTSIASNLRIQLGGHHNSNWISTYPFGHVRKNNTDLFGPPIPNHPVPARSVNIGNDVWIGNDVTIMGGVKIADGAVIAMNSHVVSDVGSYQIYGGNPARKIKDRFDPDITKELCSLKWWEFEEEEIMKVKSLLTNVPTMQSISVLKSILKL
jgi:acetyltransferase-like isoleucine patch superfamily enzyme